DRAAAEFGKLDVLVPAAGAMVAWRETAELSTDEWDRYLAVDLSGAFYVIRAALPHLRKAGGGAIVAISSIAAQMCQPPNVAGARGEGGARGNDPRNRARGGAARHSRQCRGDRPHRYRHGARRLRAVGAGDERADRSRHSAAADRHAGRDRARGLLSGRARRR